MFLGPNIFSWPWTKCSVTGQPVLIQVDPLLTAADLPTTWRERAAYLEQFGDPTSAKLWRLAAVELEQALKAHGAETLSLTEAAAISGYTADHLGSLIRQGKLPNAGRPNAPRIRGSPLSFVLAT